MASTTPTRRRSVSGEVLDEFSVFELVTPPKKHPTDIFSNGSSRLDHTLVGFDPMLELSESRDDQGPVSSWNDNGVTLEHLSPPLSTEEKDHEDSPEERQRAASNELRELAAELAKAMPRALTKEEEIGITLGESTKDSSAKKEKKIQPRVNIKNIIPATPKRKERKQPKPETPPATKDIRKSLRRFSSLARQKSNKSPSTPTADSASPKVPNEVTPTSTPTKTPKLKRLKSVSKLGSPLRRKFSAASSPSDLDIPTLAKPNPTSFLKDGSFMALKTSEQDPSSHQVEIPSSDELSMHSRLCAIVESYEKLKKKFDFNDFKGIDLQVLYRAALDESQDIPGMTPVHKVLIQQLLNCSDDICVEGFLTNDNKSKVAVFSSHSSSRFIVVYCGTTEQQLRPVRVSNKSMAVKLDPTNCAVPVYAPFRDAYFDLEKPVYKLLDTLMDANPFSHVYFVGHSFGGALATLGAVRFASARPMQRFSCHAFGSPKVGSNEFRNKVNSLPNLKIMRVEYGSDPNTGNPTDVGSLKWEHVGHTIAIHGAVGNATHHTKVPLHPVVAYRFENKKPSSAHLLHIRLNQNGIEDYVGAMEPFTKKQLPWVTSYVGEDGKGVRGANNEKRLMV